MQVTKTSTGGIITWDYTDWRAGLAPQGQITSTPSTRYTGTSGFMKMANIDPFVKYGILSPGTAPSANATNNAQLSKALVAMEMTDNSTALAVDAGGKVQQLTTSSATPVITNAGIYPHTIAYAAGSTYVGQDGILYRHNSGGTAPANSVVSFFYSAYNSNNWDVGALVNLATFDDDFMSSIPATPLDITTGDGDDSTQRTAPHTLEIGADGILYIGSGRYLHGYDGNTGNNGTFYSKVLTLPQGTQIIGLLKYKDIFLIACNYYSTGTTTSSGLSGTGQALLYTWDYTSLDIIDVVDLEDFLVASLFLWKGNPTVITSGAVERNGSNKVKVVSGNSVTKIADFDGVIPSQRGVVVLNNAIAINAGGLINVVGNRFLADGSTDSRAINNVATFGNSGFSGVLIYNQLLACLMGSSSATDGSGPVFNNMNNGMGAGSAILPWYYPEFPVGKIGRIKYVEIEYYGALTEGGSNGNLTFALGTDLSSSTYLIVANKSSVTAPLIRRYTRTTSGAILTANNASFSCINATFSWASSSGGSSPTVSRITVEYELLEVTN